MTVAGLLLAAGAGRRIGGPKALLELGGRTLVERSTALLRDGGCDVVLVVLGAEADRIRPLVHDDVVVATDWSQGIGASLRAGLAALANGAHDACVIALVDQPLVGPDAVRRLVALAPVADAAVATYAGVPGHPVLLGRAVWAEVAEQATGDSGARGWLRTNPKRVTFVDCDGTGDPRDVDTPEDLSALSPR
jgi:nicotine blue oxidoreductase